MKFRLDEPLGLPRGSVRALLSLLLVSGWLFFVGWAIMVQGATVKDAFSDTPEVIGMVMVLYFVQRMTATQGIPPAPPEVQPGGIQ